MGRVSVKKIFIIIFISILLLVISGYIIKGLPKNETHSIKAATSELRLLPSDNLVESFLGKNKNFKSGYEKDDCFNITPDFITNNSQFTIFKYNSSTASFLMFDNEIYILGEYFGGYGVTSMALADLDEDNQYEFYFTFSWGSGIHRSQAGYYNPASKKVVIFDYSYNDKELMLTTNKAGELLVNEANIESGGSFVDFTIKPAKVIGSISLEKETVTLNVADNKH